MRIRTLILSISLLAIPAGVVAQDTTPEEPPNGSFDVGGQFTGTSGDEARYQRYRDLRNGPLFDNIHFTREKDDWSFNATARHVGYRDQHYAADYWRYGRARITFTWDSTPLFYSTGDLDQFGLLSATPYRRVEDGVYRIDDGVQAALQAVCPNPTACSGPVATARQTLLYQLVNQQAETLDIRHRRDTVRVNADVTVFQNASLLMYLQTTRRNGTQPWNASFGFSNAIELPGPVDQRTTDVGTALQWSNPKTMVKVGWDGSWFTNHVSTLVWDNPLRLTDTTYGSAYSPGDGTSQGREDLWPDNTSQMISGTVTHSLPHRSKVYGNLGFSRWSQNDDLLPFTINTAIPVIPLPRSTAEGKEDITSALVGFASRPKDKLGINIRYKLYDLNNKTPMFPVTEYVRFDQVIEEFLGEAGGTTPFSYKRQYFDADATYSVMPFTSLRLGYSRETDKRTFRQFESTADNIFRVAVDTTGWQYLMLRAQYDFAHRTGEGLDEEVFDAENEGFAEPRQFDIANRNRHRVSFVATATPTDMVAVNAQLGTFRESRDTQFGLVDNDGTFFSIGADLTPSQNWAAGISYGKDHYTSFQRSRQANPGPQETDPRRDWTTDVKDDTDSISAYVEVPKAIKNTDIRYSFDWMDGLNDITYGLRDDQTIFIPPAALVQLPNASHRISRSTVDVMYRINRRLGAGVSWLYEGYSVDDWAWNPATVDGLSLNPPGQPGGQQIIPTRYLYRDYTGNTVFVRLRYFF